MERTFIAYGFEYNNKNFVYDGLVLCKSFLTGTPVYCSVILEGTNLGNVMSQMQNEEKNSPDKINKADLLAQQKNSKAEWQKVYCTENLNFVNDEIRASIIETEQMEK